MHVHARVLTNDTIDISEKRQQVLSKMESLQAQVQKVMEVLEKPEVIAMLRQDKAQSLQTLKDEYNVSDLTCCHGYTWIY